MILPVGDCPTCKQLCESHLKSSGRTHIAFWALMRHVFDTGHKLEITFPELDDRAYEDIKRRMESSMLRKG